MEIRPLLFVSKYITRENVVYAHYLQFSLISYYVLVSKMDTGLEAAVLTNSCCPAALVSLLPPLQLAPHYHFFPFSRRVGDTRKDAEEKGKKKTGSREERTKRKRSWRRQQCEGAQSPVFGQTPGATL